ncbi:MAG: 16S rRNA (guanine(527)-N(7))-methyltransferase RsmG [Bacteroidales bacterium]|nr:16S rRNA (guanine(527)-N(7))-methyltransferase RsmG [Bacteroidales bacterium]
MEIIKKYFPDLTENQINQFACLDDLYKEWNAKINVISRKDIDTLYERHVLHSLAIAKFIRFTDNTDILDVGTGGGFPGIPLAIMFPKVNFYLVDSIGKKIKVVNAIAEELKLKNVKAVHQNSKDVRQKFDFVVSRAVTAFPKFLNLVKGKIKNKDKNAVSNGIIYLKGGDLSQELNGFKNKVILTPISRYFNEDFFTTKWVLYYPFF